MNFEEWLKTIAGTTVYLKKENEEWYIDIKPLLESAFKAGRKSMREELRKAKLK